MVGILTLRQYADQALGVPQKHPIVDRGPSCVFSSRNQIKRLEAFHIEWVRGLRSRALLRSTWYKPRQLARLVEISSRRENKQLRS